MFGPMYLFSAAPRCAKQEQVAKSFPASREMQDWQDTSSPWPKKAEIPRVQQYKIQSSSRKIAHRKAARPFDVSSQLLAIANPRPRLFPTIMTSPKNGSIE